MFRFISVCFVIMVLFLGVGTFVYAQNCPNIGAPLSEGGAIWTSELQQISICSPYNIIETPQAPNDTTLFLEKKWKRADTTYYQEPDSCMFYARRKVTSISEDGEYWPAPPNPPEETWFTGIITDKGKKMSMQAQPGPNNSSYIVYADITKVNKKRLATEMTFTVNVSKGDLGSFNQLPKCAATGWGTSTRE